jgi:hypothetical protein
VCLQSAESIRPHRAREESVIKFKVLLVDFCGCDRKRLEREVRYFWWHAGFGSASGTLIFFFEVREESLIAQSAYGACQPLPGAGMNTRPRPPAPLDRGGGLVHELNVEVRMWGMMSLFPFQPHRLSMFHNKSNLCT